MAFREKTAWISVATTILIWGYYCTQAMPPLLAGTADAGDFVGLLIGCTILSVIFQVVLTVIIAVMAPRDAEARADERERLFELRAGRIAYLIFSPLAATVAISSPFVIAASPHLFPTDPLGSAVLLMANGILFSLFFAELVRAGVQIAQYRRAA
jgi:uncharacterized membrane protein